MREHRPVLVTNTTPLIALVAATGSLEILRSLYARVVVPQEVATEIRTGGKQSFGVDVTGTVGILVKARHLGFPLSMPEALQRMAPSGYLVERQSHCVCTGRRRLNMCMLLQGTSVENEPKPGRSARW